MSSFRNREYANQLVDFKGLQWGKCKCTDIDLSLDWQGKTFVFVEIKYGNTPLTMGQKIHLTALVNAIESGGKDAWAVVCHHDTPAGKDIIAAECIVDAVYTSGGWSREPQGGTLRDTLNKMYQAHCVRNMKP